MAPKSSGLSVYIEQFKPVEFNLKSRFCLKQSQCVILFKGSPAGKYDFDLLILNLVSNQLFC